MEISKIKLVLRKLDLKFLLAISCMILCISASIMHESITRILVKSNIDIFVLSVIEQIFILFIAIIVLLFTSNKWFLKYTWLNIIRAGITCAASLASKEGITASNIPLYLCGFTYLAIPTFNMFMSYLLLKEKWNNYTLILGICIFIPLTKCILTGYYSYSILWILFSCILYSFLDCTAAYMTSNHKYNNSYLAKIIKPNGNEDSMTLTFYNCVFSFITYSFLLYLRRPNLVSFANAVSKKTIFYCITMACLGWSMLPLTLLALRLKSVSSLQPIKALEPILAGTFADRRLIPMDIMAGIIGFFITALLMLIKT